MANPEIEDDMGSEKDLLDTLPAKEDMPEHEEENDVLTSASQNAPLAIGSVRISKPVAVILAIILLLLAIAATYYGFTQFNRQPLTPPTPDVNVGPSLAPSDNYTASPLVDQYGVGSTPQLVFNCQYKRVGTFASAELDGRASPGTERQDIINGLCQASSKQVFCGQLRRPDAVADLVQTSIPACTGTGGKVRIYAFHSPTCHRSADQKPILAQLAADYPNDIDLIYVCAPVLSEQDPALCKQGIAAGTYSE